VSTPTHPFELAAFATAAVPGLQVTELQSPQWANSSGAVTGIIDDKGNAWVVSAPDREMTRDGLESTKDLLTYLNTCSKSDRIPFIVPEIIGLAETEKSFVVVYADPGGKPGVDQTLIEPLFAASLGRSLAALHNLPGVRYAQSGAPVRTVQQIRDDIRDEIASGGRRVPTSLKTRWLQAVDHDPLWTFSPTPTHGSLDHACVWTKDNIVIGITDFWDAAIADPAIDLAWILPSATDAFTARAHSAYANMRVDPDLHILTRAQLYSELAVARWLTFGLESGDQVIVNEGEAMLADLAASLGSQSLVEVAEPVVPIHFSPDEEPLIRLIPRPADDIADVACDDISTVDLEDKLASYQFPPEDLADLPTEDLSAVVDDILSGRLDD
jgi:Predicted aminoglycoside phosphotransferase